MTTGSPHADQLTAPKATASAQEAERPEKSGEQRVDLQEPNPSLPEARALDVSIILATRNRAALLKQTLEYFSQQQLDGHTWEIIVIDNGSTDATPQVLAEARDYLPLVELHEPISGKNRALNQALDRARGELLVFTDDDVMPVRTWVAAYLAAARNWPGDSVFGGTCVPAFPVHTPEWLRSPDFKFAGIAFAAFHPSDDEALMTVPPFGGNMAIRARLLKHIRYSESIGPAGDQQVTAVGSETELLLRLSRAGERFVHVPAARVGHVIRDEQLTPEWLLRRAYRAGRGAARMQPNATSPRILGAPRFLWRELLHCSLRYALSWLRGAGPRCMAGMSFNSVRGYIDEYRTQNIRPAAGRTGSVPAAERVAESAGATSAQAAVPGMPVPSTRKD